MRRWMVMCAGALVLFGMLEGCGTSDRTGSGSDGPGSTTFDPATTQLTFHFTDSSVPPKFHRSYELTVGHGKVRAVIDSYGDVLHDVTRNVPEAEWRRVLDGLPAELADLPRPAALEPGCAGGTASELTVTESGSRRSHIQVENCSSKRNAAIAKRLDALVKPFATRVDLSSLTRTG